MMKRCRLLPKNSDSYWTCKLNWREGGGYATTILDHLTYVRTPGVTDIYGHRLKIIGWFEQTDWS